MPSGDPQQRQGGPFGTSATLLPVAQRMNADSERICELLLSQTNKLPEGYHVLATREASAENTLSLLARNRPCEISVG